MSDNDKHETTDDIIAEMLGAKTEFPFVYLMGEPDTPEVVDFETKEIIEPRKINIRRVTVKELANRIKAAHERELAQLREALLRCDAIAQLPEVRNEQSIKDMRNIIKRALATPATAEKSSAVGDSAKLREALELFAHMNDDGYWNGSACICNIVAKAQQALAAPPRNCDKYSHDEALDIWAVENENERNGCFDEWLYHEATEKEGGNDAE